MGVWLQSKTSIFETRDGKGRDAPVFGIGPDEPTFFQNLDAEQFEHDKDVRVVDRAAPGANYKAPTFSELKERVRAQRKKKTDAFLTGRREKAAETKAAQAEKTSRATAAVVAKSKPAGKPGAKPSLAQAKLDAEAELGNREVI